MRCKWLKNKTLISYIYKKSNKIHTVHNMLKLKLSVTCTHGNWFDITISLKALPYDWQRMSTRYQSSHLQRDLLQSVLNLEHTNHLQATTGRMRYSMISTEGDQLNCNHRRHAVHKFWSPEVLVPAVVEDVVRARNGLRTRWHGWILDDADAAIFTESVADVIRVDP